MNAKRNSLVILYEIPAELATAVPVNNKVIGYINTNVASVVKPHGVVWGTLNIIDGKVIFPNGNFDDLVLRYNGNLRFNYSYYRKTNGVFEAVRVANMIDPVKVEELTLVYDAGKKLLNVDNVKDLVSTSIKMPSILACVYMLSKSGYIDASYAQCVTYYLRVMEICNLLGCSYELPLATSTAVIDTSRGVFYTIDATKWESSCINELIIPYIDKEFYLINRASGVHKLSPIDHMGVKWCVIESPTGEKIEVLWSALVIYIQELYTHL
jgi:hypothetical protein